MTATAEPTTADLSSAQLLLAWDAKQQAQRRPGLSFSALGGCRRRAGYLLAGTETSGGSGSVQAASGSAIHEKIAQTITELFPNDLVEHEVEFAGIPGRIDHYRTDAQQLVDTKTTSARRLGQLKQHGITREWRYQTAGYAAGLVKARYPVRTIRIDVIARDTGEEWQTTRGFDTAEVAEAFDWVQQVRSLPLNMLARDYDPHGPICAGCPFRARCWGDALPGRDPRTVLYVENPDAATWADKLAQARADKKAAGEREVEAKGALDAVRPDGDTTSDPVDVGYEQLLQWKVTNTHRLDADAVRAEYAAVGARAPETVSESTSLVFVNREQKEQQ